MLFKRLKAGCLLSENRVREERRRETFPVPHAGNRKETQNGGPHLLLFYWSAGEIEGSKLVGLGS
jgi:hypothetical protein